MLVKVHLQIGWEDEFGGREASNGFGIDQQRDEPAQEGIGVGNNTTDNFNDHMVCLHRTCGVTIKHHTSGSYDASTRGCIASWSCWRDINSNEDLSPTYKERRNEQEKVQATQKTSYLWICRDSPDPEVKNSARDCPRRWPRGNVRKNYGIQHNLSLVIIAYHTLLVQHSVLE
ncbi:hypothetical protein IV203_017621 [Nitzschia inconspicua]|uniref:Uncharacterized protein n=1 Tax=Nitzschia inconspicua TaxID=303405 RepID=A0A9K3K9L9_9STRA|nr:hypothetical protein IV203_017621 [Nitzschia inconspicua]